MSAKADRRSHSRRYWWEKLFTLRGRGKHFFSPTSLRTLLGVKQTLNFVSKLIYTNGKE